MPRDPRVAGGGRQPGEREEDQDASSQQPTTQESQTVDPPDTAGGGDLRANQGASPGPTRQRDQPQSSGPNGPSGRSEPAPDPAAESITRIREGDPLDPGSVTRTRSGDPMDPGSVTRTRRDDPFGDSRQQTSGGLVSQAGDAVDEGVAAGANLGDLALDIAFQRPENDRVEFSGPGVDITGFIGGGPVFREGGEGTLDTDVTDQLTQGKGLLSDEQSQRVRERGQERRDFFGVGEEADQFVTGLTGSEELGGFARGLGNLPGDVAQAPSSIANLADLGVEVGANLPGTVQEEGAGDTAAAIGESVGRVGGAVVESAEENPFEFAGEFLGGLVAGTTAGRAVSKAGSVKRSASIRARGGDIFDLEDLSDPPVRTEGLELPGFTREAQADPDVAAREFVEQAQGNALAGDAPVAFHGRSAEAVSEFGGFGRSFEAPEGSSELPGLFQAADLSNLRLDAGGSGRSGLPRLGLPEMPRGSSRVLAERDIDIGITEGQTRREVSEFLSEDADRSQSFIRTDEGGPTPEQEAIAPPGADFESTGDVFGVRVGGREIPFTDRRVGGEIVPGRLFERGDAGDTRRAGSDGATGMADGPDAGGELLTSEQLASETTEAILESQRRADDTVVTPITNPFDLGSSGQTSTGSSGSRSMSESIFGSGMAGSGTATGSSQTNTGTGTGSGTGGGSSSGSSAPPSSVPPLFGPPSSGPSSGGGESSTPSSPPSGSPPSSSPPPSGPPSSSVPPLFGPPSSSSPPSSSGPPSSGPPSGGPPGSSSIIPGVPSMPPGQSSVFEEPPQPTDEDEDPFFEPAPTGTEFTNPIASGAQFLFGDLSGNN